MAKIPSANIRKTYDYIAAEPDGVSAASVVSYYNVLAGSKIESPLSLLCMMEGCGLLLWEGQAANGRLMIGVPEWAR